MREVERELAEDVSGEPLLSVLVRRHAQQETIAKYQLEWLHLVRRRIRCDRCWRDNLDKLRWRSLRPRCFLTSSGSLCAEIPLPVRQRARIKAHFAGELRRRRPALSISQRASPRPRAY